VAGPVANLLLAFVLMVFYFGWINEVPAIEVKNATIEWVIPGSAAAQAGIEPGDILRHFADADNPDWDKVTSRFALNPNQTVPVTVERAGKQLQLWMRLPGEPKGDDLAGMVPQFITGPITVQEVVPGNPADKAGLRAGDGIVAVDGYPFHTVFSLLPYMQEGQGKPLSLTVLRNGATLNLVAAPAKLDAGWKLGFVAAAPHFQDSPLPLKTALAKSAVFCKDNSTLLLQMLQHIATHKVSVRNSIAGPVGIARAAGDAVESKGWSYRFNLAAQISISLGVLNLMPFPILDGGMILFLLIESAIRREINIVVKERIYQAAFVMLIAFAVFITFNDVTKLSFFTHLKQ
jgi:regulator of sigma E protease